LFFPLDNLLPLLKELLSPDLIKPKPLIAIALIMLLKSAKIAILQTLIHAVLTAANGLKLILNVFPHLL